MDDWEKFNETTLPEEEEFYCNLNMEDITAADYMHMKRVCSNSETKHLGQYHDFNLKRDTLVLADIFKNFRKMCLKNLSFRSYKISFSSWISMASSFKEYRSKIRTFNLY